MASEEISKAMKFDSATTALGRQRPFQSCVGRHGEIVLEDEGKRLRASSLRQRRSERSRRRSPSMAVNMPSVLATRR